MNHLALPMAQWSLIGTSHSDGGGLINFVDQASTKAQRLSRFGQQARSADVSDRFRRPTQA